MWASSLRIANIGSISRAAVTRDLSARAFVGTLLRGEQTFTL
jgi:hypothetical protein